MQKTSRMVPKHVRWKKQSVGRVNLGSKGTHPVPLSRFGPALPNLGPHPPPPPHRRVGLVVKTTSRVWPAAQMVLSPRFGEETSRLPLLSHFCLCWQSNFPDRPTLGQRFFRMSLLSSLCVVATTHAAALRFGVRPQGGPYGGHRARDGRKHQLGCQELAGDRLIRRKWRCSRLSRHCWLRPEKTGTVFFIELYIFRVPTGRDQACVML